MDTSRPEIVTGRRPPRRSPFGYRRHNYLKSLRSRRRSPTRVRVARFLLPERAEAVESMSAALRYTSCRPGEARKATLLELVTAIGETTEDDQEVVRTVLHLLETGRVRLCGNFRNRPIDDLR